MIRKVIKWSLLVLAVLFVGAQVVRPERINPPVDGARAIEAHAQMTPEVAAILKRACYDCHSNETRWPWYSNVAPASWFVADHVKEGREHLNFSDWARKGDKTKKYLEEMCEEVREHEMPLSSYLWLHPGAKLSEQDIRTLCDWAQAEMARLAP
ncbi:MAG TPA: heme-binding domain-containing protein [Blastocatellia bacterium]|nr:heme-binding domain-containing protein [Blastocatellia bacterium]